MAVPTKFGDEFLVNSTTFNSQKESSITALFDGRFVISWTDTSGTVGGAFDSVIRAQIFNGDGTPSGGEFVANSTTDKFQQLSDITALESGGFVISWSDSSETGGDTESYAVRAQVFNPDGTALGAEFLVNTVTNLYQDHSSNAALQDGRFVIAWTDNSARDAPERVMDDVRAQIFNADGTPSGAEFIVNSNVYGDQVRPEITTLADGKFVISWWGNNLLRPADGFFDGFSNVVTAQIFNADGSRFGSEFQVNTTVGGSQHFAEISALSGGGFVVTWHDTSTAVDGGVANLRAQVFGSDGTQMGGDIVVYSGASNPSIVGLADGRFAVTWAGLQSSVADINEFRVLLQIYNADGSKSGGELSVNTTTGGDQFDSVITELVDGRLVISWEDTSQTGSDTSGAAIRAQIVDPRIAAVDLNGTKQGDNLVGTAFNDTIAGAGGDDELSGGLGDDKLLGGIGDDVLTGGKGRDLLNGGVGIDEMTGGRGNDKYFVDRVEDTVRELKGRGMDQVISSKISLDLADFKNIENLKLTQSADLSLTGNGKANRLVGNGGDNVLTGLRGSDTLNGKDGADILEGGGGHDRILGGAGDDVITGGAGRDYMSGGSGADVFIFSKAVHSPNSTRNDVITDFETGIDTIDLSAIDASRDAGDQAFTFIGEADFSGAQGELRYYVVGGSASVFLDKNGDGSADMAIWLTGVSELSADDFIL